MVTKRIHSDARAMGLSTDPASSLFSAATVSVTVASAVRVLVLVDVDVKSSVVVSTDVVGTSERQQ